jgi:maltooligosyltrehalose trehalohydrolase
MTALLLLGPGTPMLFQGQEFGSTRPFYFFADHGSELAKLVRAGRAKFLAQFPSLAATDILSLSPDPGAHDTFERCKLSSEERRANKEMLALHRDLLKLRREDHAFRSQRRRGVDGAVLGLEAFVLRFFVEGNEDRLLLVNLGRDLALHEAPEPLLAPPEGKRWAVRWSSDDWAYGGSGFVAPENDEGVWRIMGESAVVLVPENSVQ